MSTKLLLQLPLALCFHPKFCLHTTATLKAQPTSLNSLLLDNHIFLDFFLPNQESIYAITSTSCKANK